MNQDRLNQFVRQAQDHFTRQIMGDGHPPGTDDGPALDLDMLREICHEFQHQGPDVVVDWRLIGFDRNGRMTLVNLDQPFVDWLCERIKEYYKIHDEKI